jgi:hypothetical protein
MKTTLINSLINTLMKLLVGGSLFTDAKRLVHDAMNLDHLSGIEKRARVAEDLKDIYGSASTVAIDTATQLAAHWALSRGS